MLKRFDWVPQHGGLAVLGERSVPPIFTGLDRCTRGHVIWIGSRKMTESGEGVKRRVEEFDKRGRDEAI
jgi:hypothetical protein